MNNLKPFPKGFFYRDYYLLTLLNKKVVANQYVEGEWFEPGDEAYREVTSFQIDERYRISVQPKSWKTVKKRQLKPMFSSSGLTGICQKPTDHSMIFTFVANRFGATGVSAGCPNETLIATS